MSLASCLKELREERSWTQGDLCRATGLERAYISRLESGKVKALGLKNALKISKACGLTVEQFVEKCFQKEGPDSSSELPISSSIGKAL